MTEQEEQALLKRAEAIKELRRLRGVGANKCVEYPDSIGIHVSAKQGEELDIWCCRERGNGNDPLGIGLAIFERALDEYRAAVERLAEGKP